MSLVKKNKNKEMYEHVSESLNGCKVINNIDVLKFLIFEWCFQFRLYNHFLTLKFVPNLLRFKNIAAIL